MTKNNLKRLLGSQNNPFKDSSGCVSGFTKPNKNIICSFKCCSKSVNWSILLVRTGWAGIRHKFKCRHKIVYVTLMESAGHWPGHRDIFSRPGAPGGSPGVNMSQSGPRWSLTVIRCPVRCQTQYTSSSVQIIAAILSSSNKI